VRLTPLLLSVRWPSLNGRHDAWSVEFQHLKCNRALLCNVLLCVVFPLIDRPSLKLFSFLILYFSLPSFPVFKPEELRQALMPTLEALYRQDPESLPFRQPVDPQLLGIPVRIRTSNKTNLVRDCTGCHFASTPLKT